MSAAELADRRQRAAEAFDDEWSGANDMFGTAGWSERLLTARTAAIETATRVQVTPELLDIFGVAWRSVQNGYKDPNAKRRAGLIAAFRAAGFEVEG